MHHEYIDRFANLDSSIHRLDPRAKIIGALIFIGTMISIPRYEVLTLVPFLLYPSILIIVSGVPLGYIVKHIALVSPFILFLAIFSPVFDTIPVVMWGGFVLTGGMFSCLAIIIKFIATVGITLVLSSTTRFDRLLKGLGSLGIPRIILMQLSFLYRYLFLLIDEAHRMKLARDARSYGHSTFRFRLHTVGNIIAVLFLKTLDRAEHVYTAMVSRGFSGEMPVITPLRFTIVDSVFLIGSIALIFCLRFFQI